ncbi:MAG: DEAD/DEAH box helicase [Opitutales bacterium]
MLQTPFTAYARTRHLANVVKDRDFAAAFSASSIKVLPYQVAAASFALRSRHLKGCILCDEGSLGKTYEALLVIAQYYCEGKENILVVLPQNLIKQWTAKLENDFSLPYSLWAEESSDNSIQIISYEKAVKYAQKLQESEWDLIVFDEADALFKPENKSVIALKDISKNAFKLLLTPTPITISIMDIYGLIHFIDESVLPNKDAFYKRYFRKPENYKELYSWVSQFAFRTLKSQVSNYVNFTRRIPFVLNYTLTPKEEKLYKLCEKYLALPQKQAYPAMDNYQLNLQFYHTLSSSPQAFANMLKAPIARSLGEEKELLEDMHNLSSKLFANGKMADLVKALKLIFNSLKAQKAQEKAIVFVNNLSTLDALFSLLKEKSFKLIHHKEENAIERFRKDKSMQILLSTDSLAKGLDIEFCPVVINYDLLYNAIEIEQRICRCHRQGQSADVLVVNMLSPQNFSDVRILELINKRTLQFDKIFGMSDNIIGNFEQSLESILKQSRSTPQIDIDFNVNLADNKSLNEDIVEDAQAQLFTSFNKEYAEKVAIIPSYIEDKVKALEKDLWLVVKDYFQTNCPEYEIDEEAKTINLVEGNEPPLLFYYKRKSGTAPYVAKKSYGLSKDFKPASNRITLTSILVKGIFSEVSCPSQGKVKLNADIEPCSISFYNIEIPSLCNYDLLVGKTKSAKILTHEECLAVLKLPMVSSKTPQDNSSYWLKLSSIKTLDSNAISEDEKAMLLKPYIKAEKASLKDDAILINLKAKQQKAILKDALDTINAELAKAKEELNSSCDRLKSLMLKKQINATEKSLKQKQEALFFEELQIDLDAENAISASSTSKLKPLFTKLFEVEIASDI